MNSDLARSLRLLAVLCICAALSACVGRPQESAQIRDLVPMEAVVAGNGATTLRSDIQSNDGSFDILALSGGGAFGAYGAGVLSGWTESGTRPEFDIVTGVSTGALMSVYAFLGPRYDGLMTKLYTQTTKESIFVSRGIQGVFSDSLYDNSPLKAQIERHITKQLLAEIAREHAKGRRLYVATTNLDSSQLVIWDMGKIASGGRTNPLQHFQKVLRASAAVPGFFPPVYIKPQRGIQLRQAHVDGGVKAPVLIPDILFQKRKGEKNLFVIVNDSLSAKDPVQRVEPNLLSIAQKSISTLTRQLLIQTVYRGYARARHANTKFYVTSIPDSLGLGSTVLEFDQAKMQEMFGVGRLRALSAHPWKRRPPNLQSYDVAGN